MELRGDDIAEIVRIFNDSELVELRLEIGGNRLYLSKSAGGAPRWEEAAGAPVAPVASGPSAPPAAPAPGTPAAAPAAAQAPGEAASAAPGPTTGLTAAPASAAAAGGAPAAGLVEIRSPLLGVFYRRPSPDKPPFVEIGAEVGVDDAVCIIDVMKMFSRVPAGVAGRVVEILAEDGQLVEHGHVLMRLEPR